MKHGSAAHPPRRIYATGRGSARPYARKFLAGAAAHHGNREEALRLLIPLEREYLEKHVAIYGLAVIRAALDDEPGTVKILETAIDSSEDWVPYIPIDVAFAKMEQKPGSQAKETHRPRLAGIFCPVGNYGVSHKLVRKGAVSSPYYARFNRERSAKTSPATVPRVRRQWGNGDCASSMSRLPHRSKLAQAVDRKSVIKSLQFDDSRKTAELYWSKSLTGRTGTHPCLQFPVLAHRSNG
jgi:hypothetical protein